MAADDGRLERLERRVAALEDQIAIYQLLMTYGPSADSGSDDVVRAIHHPDAEYDSGLEVFRGGEQIGDMIASLPLHRDIMAGGSAHLATMPVVHVDGDRATAVCHGQLLRFDREADAFRIWRATAVRLEFRRTGDGWKIYRRANRLLDGSDASHQHFRDGLEAVGAAPGPAVPAEAVPAEAVPAEAVPAEAVPAEAVPAEVVPADAPAG